MNESSHKLLPKILIVDDQFGRCQLGSDFREKVGADTHSLFEADRDNLCRNFGLLVQNGFYLEDPVAIATFCPAQRWNALKEEIENYSELALGVARQGWPDRQGERWSLILLDLRFTEGKINSFGDPERGSLFGVDVLLPLLRQEFGEDLPIVILSSAKREELNPRVRELGALDFIQRIPGAGAPPDESRRALREALFLHGLLPDPSGLIVGQSLATLKMLRQARRGARSARTILLEGETGVGKGLLAKYIHQVSGRSDGPFETFLAAQRTAELQADELFGHWRGAFTDAKGDQAGVWERARGGTLFIDEVADLDEGVQQRLMQPIEERRVRRIGHPPAGVQADVDVEVGVVLATNRSLAGVHTLKQDFLNRINAFVIRVPPLRERLEDLPSLTRELAGRLAPTWRGRLLPGALQALQQHEWRDGNVRELRNVLERALTNNPGQDLTAQDLLPAKGISPSSRVSFLASNGGTEHRSHQTLMTALDRDPETMAAVELRALRADLHGFLPGLLAELLQWALRVTANDGVPNHTAAVRFLLGKEAITTVEAKQFLRKLLSLDTRGDGVWRAFEALEKDSRGRLLDSLLRGLHARSAARSGQGK